MSDDILINLSKSEMYQHQWHLHGCDENGLPNFCSIHAEKAWHVLGHYGDNQVTIGFADDGCLLSAIDSRDGKFASAAFLENGRLISGETESVKERMFIPGYRHGTALAGLMAAPLSSLMPVGVAPGCRLLPVRWEFNKGFHITQDGFRRILSFLSDKIDVFVNTWARLPSMIMDDETLRMIQMLSRTGGRRGRGILFVWAAGNSGCPIHHTSDESVVWDGYVNSEGHLHDIKKAYQFTHSLIGNKNVLLVGAVNCHGQRAHYSCYGTGLSVCAPSNNRHCFGANLYLDKGLTTCSADESGFTHNFKGTSGAAALVGGVAALVISANPGLDATQVSTIIKNSASKSLNLCPYPVTSFTSAGTPSVVIEDAPVFPFHNGNFDVTGWSPWFGYGLVNAEVAVKKARL
ncbi:MAG TPA: S8 family serine peptidase [Buttiauxella sp.]|jgi:hypothetical protein